jgi:hypothetical protein
MLHVTQSLKFTYHTSHQVQVLHVTCQTKFKVHMHGTDAFCMLHIACHNIFKDGCRMSQDFEKCMSQPFYHHGPQSQEHLGVAPHWDGTVEEHHDLLAALHYQCSIVQY